jgi:disulfide bond formation protein DsbB
MKRLTNDVKLAATASCAYSRIPAIRAVIVAIICLQIADTEGSAGWYVHVCFIYGMSFGKTVTCADLYTWASPWT